MMAKYWIMCKRYKAEVIRPGWPLALILMKMNEIRAMCEYSLKWVVIVTYFFAYRYPFIFINFIVIRILTATLVRHLKFSLLFFI